MASKESFGLRMRHARECHGLSLELLARETKVAESLWSAMERNDFSRWPSGIFARAYIREYAEAVGLDPVETVDEFCRYFPLGDRRIARVIREQAQIVGATPQYQDELLPAQGDRRAARESLDGPRAWIRFLLGNPRAHRALAATIDIAAIATVGLTASGALGRSRWAAVAITGLAYHTVGVVLAGRSPGFLLLDTLRDRLPFLVAGEPRPPKRLELRPQ